MQDPKLVRQNRRMRYLLTHIEVLSKFAWVFALKSKRGMAVCVALRHLLENEPPPRRSVKLHTDQGKEFYNRHVQPKALEPKAVVAERFNPALTYKNSLTRT